MKYFENVRNALRRTLTGEIIQEPSTRFQKFIMEVDDAEGTLPLIHTTPAFSFSELCHESHISPRFCRHFKKDLIYLFYGRPAYRTQESEHSTLEFNWPIVFIFDPDRIDQITSIFPVDSGAFHLNLYRKFFHKDTIAADLELAGNLSSARRVVNAFFGSSEKYITGRSQKNVEIASMQYEAIGVNALARLPPTKEDGEVTRDERSATVEVQTSMPIDIKDATIGIIIPQPYLNEPMVVEAIARWNIDEVMTFEIFEHQNPGSWIDQIYALTKGFYKRKGFLG